ncbi:hypothetical protein KGF54_003215 [Candida jiufengensis]|uniref:uncharacterized protein n=1 Tax=Candida jiufengensis TaxID=497108 RepID=UPI002224C304|nr:uncharacterized protein KGF54_003215 [Candida jiufengensis]KAI5952349.1 hypothetical protein KGF54_003215 [Candida jiufengensis]
MIPTIRSPRCVNSQFRQSIRTIKLRRTVNKLVEVQLLKTLPGIGVEGQILHVKPGFMRNYLHIDNKACYITPNNPPRLPIVDVEELRQEEQRKRRIAQQQQIQKQKLLDQQAKSQDKEVESTEDKETDGAMSLEELSDLFSSMKSNKRKPDSKPELKVQSNVFEESSESNQPTSSSSAKTTNTDPIHSLTSKLPKLLTLNASSLPISKQSIIKQIQEITGDSSLTLQQVELSYIDTPETTINEISERGRYQVKLNSTLDDSFVTQVLEVE